MRTLLPRLYSWLNRALIAELGLPRVSTRQSVLEAVRKLKENKMPSRFEVTDGKSNGICVSHYDHFDVFWNTGRKQLDIPELSVYGIRKGRK